VYLSNKESLFHETASEKFKQVTDTYEIWISRQVLREYAVVISREGFYEKPLEPEKISSDLEKWEKSFQVIDETEDITKNLKALILKYRLKGKRIHDANIVASMIKHSIPLLFTLNVKDFQAFDEIKVLDIQTSGDTNQKQSEPSEVESKPGS
jgi:predicted nucleic acid-binding protein